MQTRGGLFARAGRLLWTVGAGLGVACVVLALYMDLTATWIYKAELAHPELYPVRRFYEEPTRTLHPTEPSFAPDTRADTLWRATCCQVGVVDRRDYHDEVGPWWAVRDDCDFQVACVFRGVGRMGEHTWLLAPDEVVALEPKSRSTLPDFVRQATPPHD